MSIDPKRIENAYTVARNALFEARSPEGCWVGELSTSALGTATAVAALALVSRERHAGLVGAGLRWLSERRNADGGWGDTPDSPSNLATTSLSSAAFRIAGASGEYAAALRGGDEWVRRIAGATVPKRMRALEGVYGKDRTFATPILTMCALSGDVDWSVPAPLPYELARIPPRFYRALHLRVVSYALPALIAIGQLLHARNPTRNPLLRRLRDSSVEPTLRKLEEIQPSSGGFLEAIPLTAFVVMSLAANGRAAHHVAERGVAFLVESARPDGGWPIEINLKTWLTTLAVAALSHEGWRDPAVAEYLSYAQYRETHPYTQAAPGGWAWTDLPGGVPDADDTSGALLALRQLGVEDASSVRAGVDWLLGLQNADGGWPTFCRGWGKLPFDRSAPDLTAHALRALKAWPEASARRCDRAVERGFAYLSRVQQPDGSWLPLWFGNQQAPQKRNPVYGTARVLLAYSECGRKDAPEMERGVRFLLRAQNDDGSWGGASGVPGTVEESALCIDALADAVYNIADAAVWERGVEWLTDQVEKGRLARPAPIGLYFEQLWYAEKLYPHVWTVAALGRAQKHPVQGQQRAGESFSFQGGRV